MNSYDKCKNCGGERGLHHFETDQCPVGGREAPIGRRQEWKTTTFGKEDDNAELEPDLTNAYAVIAKQAATIRELEIIARAHLQMAQEQAAKVAKLRKALTDIVNGNYDNAHEISYARRYAASRLEEVK
jgi:hypothetical protein